MISGLLTRSIGSVRQLWQRSTAPPRAQSGAEATVARSEAGAADTLCALPFVHFNVMPNGQASPCCQSPAPIRDETGRPLNVRTDPLSAIWNSADMRGIRSAMLRGERPQHCMDCYRHEDKGFKSTRINYNRMLLNEGEIDPTFTGFSRISRENFAEVMGKPTYFDLRFDNVCNLKCVMCFASESSSIERDDVHMAWTGEAAIERTPNRFDNSRKWIASDLLYEELVEMGANAEYIRLAGGEPFRSAMALRWMDYLGKSGKAANITLQIYTNMTLFNERIISLLAPFKYISFVLSIDGTEDTYEYIRYPGKWSQVVASCNRLNEERKGRLRNSEVSINATMSLAGAMRILDVFEFGRVNGYGVTLSNAIDPPHASTRYLPTAAKKRLEQDLRAYAERHGVGNLPSQIDQWMEDMYAVDIREPQHRTNALNAMRFLNDMDASRNLDFKKLNPDLVRDFEAEIGWCDETMFAEIAGAAPTELLGTIADDQMSLAGRKYAICEISGGAVEGVAESSFGYTLRGWAVDTANRKAASAVAVAIGDDVVLTVAPSQERPDIAGGFGEGSRIAGFLARVQRRGNRPTTDEPIRVFALTKDGKALPLAATFDDNVPISKSEFST